MDGRRRDFDEDVEREAGNAEKRGRGQREGSRCSCWLEVAAQW